MADVQIQLAAVWIALMLTYLLGDVLRIFSGDFQRGEIQGMRMGQKAWLGIAALMVIPILMVVLTLFLSQPVGQHHRGGLFLPLQPGWAADVPGMVRQIFDRGGPGLQCADGLARLALVLEVTDESSDMPALWLA